MSKSTGLFEFGYNFIGPMCANYLQHLNKEIEKYQPSHVLFLAREGYFLHRAYQSLLSEKLVKDVNTAYLRVSRTFMYRISIADPYTWQWSLSSKFTGTLQSLLTGRFGFTVDQVKELFSEQELETDLALPEQRDEIETIFRSHLRALRHLVTESRQCYQDYLQSVGISEQSRLLMVDVGYSGSIQKLLTRLLNQDTYGLYFITTESGEYEIEGCKATMHYTFADHVKMGEGYTMLDRSLFIESLLTAPDGQFVDIARNSLNDASPFQFFYGKKAYTQHHFHELNILHEGAIKAIMHFARHDINFSKEEIETMFNQMVTRKNMIPRSLAPLFEVDDAVSGNGDVNAVNMFGL